jgi:predicted transcriptional regulator
MTMTTPRPPYPGTAPPGFAYVAVTDPEWRVAGDAVCSRHTAQPGNRRCGEPAVAEKAKPGDPIHPWRAYCAAHAHGRWVQGGEVMRWDLRRKGREAEPLTGRELAGAYRAHGGGEGKYCSQHHGPRSQCPPGARHTQPLRCSDDLIARVEDVAGALGLARNDVIEMALEAIVAMPAGKVRELAAAQDRVKSGMAAGTRGAAAAIEEETGRRRRGHAAGTAVFLEPGGHPVVAAPVPDRKKGRRS